MAVLWQISAIPVLGAILSLILPAGAIVRRLAWLLMCGQMGLVVAIAAPLLRVDNAMIFAGAEFSIDKTSAIFLLLTTFVVTVSLWHAERFFQQEQRASDRYQVQHERVFFACTYLFLLAMSFVFICDNLGFLWIAIESTTLASAPLVYFGRTKHSIEATWKYFIICSVGIAFALLGTILVFASSQHGAIAHGSLNVRALCAVAGNLEYSLLRLGFLFCLLGYGTKAGIFPLHSWLPDAHSEAPAPASSMLSGALLNCALFAIWRVSQIVVAAHHQALSFYLDVGMGTATVVAASLFLVKQHGIKRLWAYSSVENVGLMLVAIGLGSPALFALQAVNHSLCKVSLFLLSGNVIQYVGSKSLRDIRGLSASCPAWSALLVAAAIAVTGAPPFGAFVSEFLILSTLAKSGYWLVLGLLSFGLALSFIAVSLHVGRMLVGTPKENLPVMPALATSVIPATLLLCSLLAGITSVSSWIVPK